MKISENKVVELKYELEVDGNIIDAADENSPLDYIHGSRMLLPGFEAEIDGLSEGDEFSFTLSSQEGYGEYDESQLMELPKSAFEVSGAMAGELLKEGNILPLVNGEGMVVRGVVKEVNEDFVTMDFNHPMAGKTLKFTGKILSVREATEKELKEGLHGEFLPVEGCGCCHGEGHHHGHHHGEEGCCHGEGHHHGHHHGEGGCCHGEGHHHGHHHGEGGCCHGEGHHHGHHHGDKGSCNN